MSCWQTTRPITSQHFALVTEATTGREGWRLVRWNDYHQPELFGPVTDDSGRIIDANPDCATTTEGNRS